MNKYKVYENVVSGTVVESGYSGITLTAPSESGHYTLYELASASNTHIGWEWVKE